MKLILGRIKVSDEDYDFVSNLNISMDRGYAYAWFEGKAQSLHSLIGKRMGRVLKAGQEWDHMDRDRGNDQRWNLRLATRRQSKLNKKPSLHGASGFLGVSWDARKQAWAASTMLYGKYKHLSYCNSAEEAARFRDYYCSRSFDREFYVYNFPKELDFSDLRIRLWFHLEKGLQP